MMKADSNGGCGCGGAGGSRAGGCGCSGALGETIRSTDGFVRPMYSAGQLLTEDDLQLGVDHEVARRRLHNRMLFGSGVANGFQVRCDPCDPRQLRVLPGYGIDGIGRDLYLPCPTSVDVIKMARQIQAEGGCTAGCDDARGISRSYTLRASYTESYEDPVVPHVVEAGCATSAPLPAPTRLRESLRFTLDCGADDCGDRPLDPTVGRIVDLLGDVADIRDTVHWTAEVVDAADSGRLAELTRVVTWATSTDLVNGLLLRPPPQDMSYPRGRIAQSIANPLGSLGNNALPADIDEASEAMGLLLSRWYLIWMVRRTGRPVLPDVLDPDLSDQIMERLDDFIGFAVTWSEVDPPTRDSDHRLEPFVADARMEQRRAVDALLRHLVARLAAWTLEAGGEDPDGGDPPNGARLRAAFLGAIEAGFEREDPRAGYPADRIFEVDVALALDGMTLERPELLRAWKQRLAAFVGRVSCRGEQYAGTRCQEYRRLQGMLKFDIGPQRPPAELLARLLGLTDMVNLAARAMLHDAVCEAHITPMPVLSKRGVELARVTVVDCVVTEVCVAGRSQIASPWAMRSNPHGMDAWGLCRSCCGQLGADRRPLDGPLAVGPQAGGAQVDGAPPARDLEALLDTAEIAQAGVVRERRPPFPAQPVEEADDPGADAEGGQPPAGDVEGSEQPGEPIDPLAAGLADLDLRVEEARTTKRARTPAPPWSPRMLKNELLAVARRLDLPVTPTDTKSRIIDAIEAYEKGEA